MATITLPTKVYFEAVDKLQLLRAGQSLRSRYTGKRQHVSFPFALWILEGKLIPMEGVDAGEWRAFLTDLEGQKNNFRLPVPGSPTPLSGFTGNATVGTGGAAARAKSMPIVGPASTLLLKKGDYFNVGDELKVATAPVTTDGLGAATVQFQPFLKRAHLAAATVTIQNPFILLVAADDESGTWALERPVRHNIELICIEDFS